MRNSSTDRFTNTLWTGDNLYVLNGLNSESVDLVYLDPPFNSKRMYSAPIGSDGAEASFKDIWTWSDVDEAYLGELIDKYPSLVQYIDSVGNNHSTAMMSYLTFMTQRLIQIHRVLKSTGSLYLHCDPTASHYLKVVLDRLFGKNKFRNEIVWYKGYRGTPRKNRWQQEHDILLFYAKGDKYTWNNPLGEYKDPTMSRYNKIDESGQRYALIKRRRTDGSVYYGKTYPKGKKAGDVIEIPTMASTKKERTNYPTQKPLELLKRIIEASSNKNDIVLDPFCGCATTCVAAEHLGRNWIGIDIEETARDLVIGRLSDAENPALKGSITLEDLNFIHRTDTPQRTDIKAEPPSTLIKEQLYQEQNMLCNGCQNKYLIKDMDIDHIIPTSKGGGDYKENYQLLCGNCNSIKGNRPMEYLRTIIKQRQLLGKKITFGS